MNSGPIDSVVKDILITIDEIRQKGASKFARGMAISSVAKEAFSRIEDRAFITTTAGLGTGRSTIPSSSVAWQNTKNCAINIGASGTKLVASFVGTIPLIGKPINTVLDCAIDGVKGWATSGLDQITPATLLEAHTLREKALQGMVTGNMQQVNHALKDLYGCLKDHSKNFTTEQKVNYLQEVFPIINCYIQSLESGLKGLTHAVQKGQSRHEVLKKQTHINTSTINQITDTLNTCQTDIAALANNMQTMQNSLTGVVTHLETLEGTVNQFIQNSCYTFETINSKLAHLSNTSNINSEICQILFNQYLQVDISNFQGNEKIVELYHAFQQASSRGDIAQIKKAKNQLDQEMQKEQQKREQFDDSLVLFNHAGHVLSLAANLAGKPEMANSIQANCSALSKIAIGVAWHFGLGTLAATTGPLGVLASTKCILEGLLEIKSYMQGEILMDPLAILKENMQNFQKKVKTSFERVDRIFSVVFHKLEFLRREQIESQRDVQRIEQKLDVTVAQLQEQLNHTYSNLNDIEARQSAIEINRYEEFERTMHELVAKLAESHSQSYAKEIFTSLSPFITFYRTSFLNPTANENSFYHSGFETEAYAQVVNHINLFRGEFEKRFQITHPSLPHLTIWSLASKSLATAYLHDTKLFIQPSAESYRLGVLQKALSDGYNLIHFINILRQPNIIQDIFQSYKKSLLNLIYAAHIEIKNIEQEYIEPHFSLMRRLRRENTQLLHVHTEIPHVISEEMFLSFTKANIGRGPLSGAYHGFAFLPGAIKDIVTFSPFHLVTRIADGILKNDAELLADNIYFVSDSEASILKRTARFESSYMKRLSDAHLEPFIRAYLAEQKTQDERLWQKAIHSLQATNLEKPSMNFFEKISFLPYTLSPSVAMFPYPCSIHEELKESPLLLPLSPQFPHLHTNTEAKFLELIGEKKTVFYYDHNEKNFIVHVFSGPINADELQDFKQFGWIASHSFENPIQSTNLKEKIWRLWMGGSYPTLSEFNKKSPTFSPQGYEATTSNQNSLIFIPSNESHFGLIDYLTVDLPKNASHFWNEWVAAGLKSDCPSLQSCIQKKSRPQPEKISFKSAIKSLPSSIQQILLPFTELAKRLKNTGSKSISIVMQEKMREIRTSVLKKKMMLTAENSSSALGQAIQKVDHEFKFLIGLLSLLFPQLEASHIGFCNKRTDILQYLSLYNGEEQFLTHLLENQLMFVDIFGEKIQEELKTEKTLSLVQELQKTCDLLASALESSANKPKMPVPFNLEPKILDSDEPEKDSNAETHIKALANITADYRHIHVRHLATFIKENNRDYILDILLRLKNDWNPMIRENIYYELGKHGYIEKSSLIKTLLNGLKDSYPPAQFTAAQALVRLQSLTSEVVQTLLLLTRSPMNKIANQATKMLKSILN